MATPQFLRGLQVQIHNNPACAEHILTNEMPPVTGTQARAKDSAIAAILNVSRTKVAPLMISERGVRSALSTKDGAFFLKLLRDINTATEAPGWLTAVLSAMGLPAEAADDRWAYFDTLQCGWTWLRGDGLDLGAQKTRDLLSLIAAGNPGLAAACTTLKNLAVVPDPVTVEDVSKALRGPWGDEEE